MSVIHPQSRREHPGELHRLAALDALSDASQWAVAAVRDWGRRLRERDQLARLSERMLQDIGMTHTEREILANKWFWRE